VREVCSTGVHDDAQQRRLQADIFLAAGSVSIARTLHVSSSCSPRNAHQRERPAADHLDAAQNALDEALRLARESYAENDIRCARIYTMKGRIARHFKKYEEALNCFESAWETWNALEGQKYAGAEIEVLRTMLQIAESFYNCGRVDEACQEQSKAIETLKKKWSVGGDSAIAKLLIDAAAQLAHWLQSQGKNEEGVSFLILAEDIVTRSLGDEHNVFTYSWEDHCSTSLYMELDHRRKSAPHPIPKEEWDQCLQIVDQYGTLIDVLDHGENLDKNLFPVTVKIKDSSEKHKWRCQLVDIKRDIALLQLKLKKNDEALQYLNEVHYFERCLHGSQSNNVARTLKALGTVYLAKRSLSEAESCLRQSLRIFENEHPPNIAHIRDIQAKLHSINAM